jgi:hypothetical protein
VNKLKKNSIYPFHFSLREKSLIVSTRRKKIADSDAIWDERSDAPQKKNPRNRTFKDVNHVSLTSRTTDFLQNLYE